MIDWLKWMMVGDVVRAGLMGGFIGLGIAALISLGFDIAAVVRNARALKEPPDLYDLRVWYFHTLSEQDAALKKRTASGGVLAATCSCDHCNDTRAKLGLMRTQRWRTKNIRLS